jgi:hypothetical protein
VNRRVATASRRREEQDDDVVVKGISSGLWSRPAMCPSSSCCRAAARGRRRLLLLLSPPKRYLDRLVSGPSQWAAATWDDALGRGR